MKKKPVAYIPGGGKAVVKHVVTPDGRPRIDLSLNESSYGASPLAAAAAGARVRRLNRYPDPASSDLRRAIGKTYGLDPEQITCGNGSEEIIDIIGRLFARGADDELLFSEYAFLQFPIVAMRVGATAVRVPMPGLTNNVDCLLAGLTPRTRVVFLANPDNPTGTWIPVSEIRRLHENLPADVVLVIDSAYGEYVDDAAYSDGLEMVAGNENVIVTHTFSKAFGLAALRVGWSCSSTAMAATINRMRGIGNVNAIAQEAAAAALEDQAFVARVREQTAIERDFMTGQLEGLGLSVVPGAVNFLLTRFPDDSNHTAAAAHTHLAGDGIIVRTNDDYGLDNYLRITLGLREENEAVIASLKRFFV